MVDNEDALCVCVLHICVSRCLSQTVLFSPMVRSQICSAGHTTWSQTSDRISLSRLWPSFCVMKKSADVFEQSESHHVSERMKMFRFCRVNRTKQNCSSFSCSWCLIDRSVEPALMNHVISCVLLMRMDRASPERFHIQDCF